MLDQLLDSPNFGFETLLLLPVLVALEAVLSADNAIALAALTQGLHDEKLQQRALNIGLVLAYILRMVLILTATWVIRYWQFELAGALYLLWLVVQYFTSDEDEDGIHQHHGPRFKSLWQAIPMLAITDLAFSLDSVTTAIAVSQEIWLVLLGATIGIITLRFMAGLFIRWLNEFTHLEDAGYITVSLVGLRLLARVVYPNLVPAEWLMISLITVIFIWGFSERIVPPSETGSQISTEISTELIETPEELLKREPEEAPVESKK
ncbi:TerC family protein [Leptothermofonsia sp. ETS-13]|uniref:TerC family protein n=1 Tax=Leptothermofonsia sp. ETS-13 TaxID=3035696 RepID=UPI003BA14555